MSMFNRNTPPDEPTGPPQHSRLVPQRTFKVEYIDGSNVAQHELIVCRAVRLSDMATVQFLDVVFEDGELAGECIVLEVVHSRYVSRREIVEPTRTSALVVQ